MFCANKDKFEIYANNLLAITNNMCEDWQCLYERFYEDKENEKNIYIEFFEKYLHYIKEVMNNIYGNKKRKERMINIVINKFNNCFGFNNFEDLINFYIKKTTNYYKNKLYILKDKFIQIEQEIKNIYNSQLKSIRIIDYIIAEFNQLILNII